MAPSHQHGMPHRLACPQCGRANLDLREYRSMMVLSADLAFFSLDCPHCAARVATVQAIPASLRDMVEFAAIKVGAGMGHGR